MSARSNQDHPDFVCAARHAVISNRGRARRLTAVELQKAAAVHLSLSADPMTPLRLTTALRATERRTIEQVLRETDGNKAKAARRLGLTRTQL